MLKVLNSIRKPPEKSRLLFLSLTLNTEHGCWLVHLRVKQNAIQKFMIKKITVTLMATRLKLIMNIVCRFSLGHVFIACNSSVHDVLTCFLLDFHSGFIIKYCDWCTIHNILCYSYKVIFYCGFADTAKL